MLSPIPVTVAPPAEQSRILVSPGLLANAGRHLRDLSRSSKALVVTDTTVAPLYLADIERSLYDSGFAVISHTLPAGESHKHLETLLPAFETFLSATIDRQTPLLALGGGVTGDMAGLLAGTLLRGLPFVQVPTTLMAMVDSAIGGKTAVNSKTSGKNLIGVFHQPRLTLSDPSVLRTLPSAEISNGLAECVKHDAIRDAEHFSRLPELLPRALAKDLPTLESLIHHNASIKARVVTEDPHEKGVRAHLNFGHTFAHAIELATDHAIPHGAAVSLGIAAAAYTSTALGLLPPSQKQALIDTLRLANLPVSGLKADPDAMLAAMKRDKKVEHGLLRFILLEQLGTPVIRPDVPESLVREALAFIAQAEAAGKIMQSGRAMGS